jgi:4-hydroxy-3-methylbut-2-enyl diphosphate reductase
VALGAFFLSFAVADNLSVPFSYDVALLVSLYYLSMSLMNGYTNRFSFKLDNPRSYNFITRFRSVFITLFCISFAGIFFIAVPLGNEILLLTVFSVALGIAYNLSYFPMGEKWRKIFFFRIRDLLSLKSMVLAFAVTILLNGLTLLKHFPTPWSDPETSGEILSGLGFYFSIYYVFLLMFTREVLFEMKTLQTDRIVGVSSLLNIFSRKTIRIFLYLLPTLLLIAMIIGIIVGAYPRTKIKYFIAVIYNYLLVYLSINPRLFHNRTRFELMVESNLYVAGLISFI